MKINAGTIKIGNILEIGGKLFVVNKTYNTQPGKGGAYIQVEMKDIIAGNKVQERWSVSDTVERAILEQKDMQYLYTEADTGLVLMDPDTYDQVTIDTELLGEQIAFITDGMKLTVHFHQEKAISASVPDKVTCVVSEADPVIKGQTVTSSYKPAVLDNGLNVMVPPFIASGDKIIVRTEDITYIERAKE